MAVVRRMVSMNPEDCSFIDDNAISLSKFVRNSIKNMKESQNQPQQEIQNPSEDSI